MKKLLFSLLTGLFLFPMQSLADHYPYDKLKPLPNIPVKAPARYWIAFDIDYYTGDLYISPNYDITGLQITINGNGMTYLDTTVSLTAGEAYTTSMAGYDEGEYTLTLTNGDGDVISQYVITVEPD